MRPKYLVWTNIKNINIKNQFSTITRSRLMTQQSNSLKLLVCLPITPSYRFHLHLCCNQVISFHVFEEDNNGTVCSVDMVCTGFYLNLYISDLLQVAHVSNMQMYADDTVTYTHAKTAKLLASKLTIAMLMEGFDKSCLTLNTSKNKGSSFQTRNFH